MNPSLLLFLLLMTGNVFAWSSLRFDHPSLEDGLGLAVNPATLGPLDGPGWMLSGRENRFQGSLHSEYLAGGFEWSQNDLQNGDQSIWSLAAALGDPGDWFSVGLRSKLWRSSDFQGNAVSLTPGFLVRPWNWLSLGYAWENALHHRGFEPGHLLGASVRPVQSLIGTVDLKRVQKEWNLRGRADLLYKGYRIGFGFPIRHHGNDSIHVEISVPVGNHQTVQAGMQGRRFIGAGISGHLKPSPEAAKASRWVRIQIKGKIDETHHSFLWFKDSGISLTDLRRQFRILEADPTIQGVFFDFDGFESSLTTAAEIRREILSLKQKKIQTIAYLTELRLAKYYAASACDQVFLQPSSLVHLRGLSSTVLHYKGLLDYLGVRPELMRHGKYKSAVEPYLRDSLSPEAREDLQKLLTGLWQQVRDSIAIARSMTPEQLDRIVEGIPLTANQAKVSGLVDSVLYIDEATHHASIKNLQFHQMESRDLYQADWKVRPKILVIHVEGEILDGNGRLSLSGASNVPANPFGEVFSSYGNLKDYQALVLRIHSPGGSAQASDILWHRIMSLKKELGIPVVASVAGMAASGGYYIACAADQIVAEPTSLVGSIGVFGGKVDASALLSKLRITTSTVKTHPAADAESFTRGFTAEETKALQSSMDDIYERFTKVVSDSRKIAIDKVDSIAEGRIFTGMEAQQKGLVDVIGGIDRSIQLASSLAGIPTGTQIQTVHGSYRAQWDFELDLTQTKLPLEWLNQVLSLAAPQVWAYWNMDLQ